MQETTAGREGKVPANIKHHSGFVSGLEVLLWEYREKMDIRPEVWLSTEGIRMDVLILKRDPALVISHSIGKIFKGHNILEYKRGNDSLGIDVFAKVMAYTHLYKSQGRTADSISYDDVSATIYRHSYPRDAFRDLRRHGASIEEEYPGVFYVKGMSPFPVQILVGRLLDPKEYAMFRVLTPGASDEDIRNFKNMAIRNDDATYQKSVDDVFQVSVSANREAYDRLMKEDPEMCEALKDLMKEEFEKTEARGFAKGEIRGEIKGAIKLYRDEMELTPTEIIGRIISRYNLMPDVAEKYVDETLGLQPA